MAGLADEVFSTRAARNAARAELEGHIARVRGDLEERGLAGRIADDVTHEAQAALDEAVDIAGQSKGIIAATLALLAIWFLRNPIIDWLENLMGSGDEREKE